MLSTAQVLQDALGATPPTGIASPAVSFCGSAGALHGGHYWHSQPFDSMRMHHLLLCMCMSRPFCVVAHCICWVPVLGSRTPRITIAVSSGFPTASALYIFLPKGVFAWICNTPADNGQICSIALEDQTPFRGTLYNQCVATKKALQTRRSLVGSSNPFRCL